VVDSFREKGNVSREKGDQAVSPSAWRTHNLKLVVVVKKSYYTLIKSILILQTSMDSECHTCLGLTLLHLHHPFADLLFPYNHLRGFAYLHWTLLRQTFRHHNLGMGDEFSFHSKSDQACR